MKIRGLLIDVKADPGMVNDIWLDEDIIENFYDVLQCDLIDIVKRPIGGIEYNIVCDDEGLFDAHPYVSAVDEHDNPMLVGNLFICNDDGEGRLTSLTEDDIQHIGQYIHIHVHWVNDSRLHVAPELLIC